MLDDDARGKWEKKIGWKGNEAGEALRFVRQWTDHPYCQRNFRDQPLGVIEPLIGNAKPKSGKALHAALLGSIWWHDYMGHRLVLEKDPAGWSTLATAWKIVELLFEFELHTADEGVRKFLGLPKWESTPGNPTMICPSINRYMWAALRAYIAVGELEPVRKYIDHVYRINEAFHSSNGNLLFVLAWRILGQPWNRPIRGHDFEKLREDTVLQWEKDEDFEAQIWQQMHGIAYSKLRPVPCERHYHLAWSYLGIRAIQRVREHEGRRCVIPDHPMMQVPLLDVPRGVDYQLPDWYEPLARTLRMLYSEDIVSCR